MSAIQRTNLPDEVANRILELIRDGKYRPGDRLPPERELAKTFDVGRTSIREGLRHLNSLGIVHSRQGKGVLVRSLSLRDILEPSVAISGIAELLPDEISQIMHVRRVLELESVSLAAMKRTSAHSERLGDLLEEMNESLADLEEFLDLDLTFHVVIADASGNEVLSRLIQFLRNMYLKHSGTILRNPQIAKSSLEFHRLIYEAILAQDGERAKECMLKHLIEGEKAVLANLAASRQ